MTKSKERAASSSELFGKDAFFHIMDKMQHIKEKQILELNELYEKSNLSNIKSIISDIISMAEQSRIFLTEIKSKPSSIIIERQRDYAMYDHLLSDDISIESGDVESLLKATLKKSNDIVGVLSILKLNYGPDLRRRLEALENNEIQNKNKISNLLDTFIYRGW